MTSSSTLTQTAAPRGPRPSSRRDSVGCAVLAAVVAVLLLTLGPVGGDQAAHDYQRWLFREHGFTFWNNYWYAGRYSFITYSTLYYPVAALFGIGATAVASVALAAGAYCDLVLHRWGGPARVPAYAFAIAWGAAVLGAAFPFLLGAAFTLAALAAAERGARWTFSGLAVLSLAASPVAFVLLAICIGSVAVAARRRREAAHLLLPIAGLTLVEIALWRAFPDAGRYPFARSDVVYVGTFCLIGLLMAQRVPSGRVLRAFFGVYLAVSVVAFVVPSPLGGNIVRLRLAALPVAVLVLSLRQWRPLLPSAAALVATGIWTLTPAVGAFTHADAQRSAAASYWTPVVEYLQGRLGPGDRVEVVDTEGHWGAVHLPKAGIPLVRGWFRQQDFPVNELLYDDQLDADDYRDWLLRLGVAYVVLPDADPDYSARREASLLRSGRSGLELVARVGRHVVYAPPSPQPLVQGAGGARVIAFDHDHLSLEIDRAGRYHVGVRYTPYWRPSAGCVRRGVGGLTVLDVRAPGDYHLVFDPTWRRVLAVLGRTPGHRCA